MSGQLMRLTGAAKRLSADPHFQADVLFAILVGVVSVTEALQPDSNSAAVGADTFAFVTIVIASASLILRRHLPLIVFGIVVTTVGLFYLRGGGDFLSLLGLSAFYAVAAHARDRRRAWITLLISAPALFAIAWFTVIDQPDGYDLDSAASMVAFLVGTIAVGTLVRNRQRVFADSEHRASAAEADRQANAARAVAEERSRIAREMHDVVAHGMSVISVQAAAAQEIVHDDPDKAAEVLGRIENVGRQSLNEMRRMLGILRNGDDSGASLAPQPSLVDVPGAVKRSVEAGVVTDLVITGDVRELSPGVELTAFRVVQEALTNVLKHAGPTAIAAVSIDYRTDDVVIDISDNGRGAVSRLANAGGGNGLIGMRERVEIYGGSLSTGPRTGGGYAVRAVLPTDEPGARVPLASIDASTVEIER
jgi:signal transduction histidine kinase